MNTELSEGKIVTPKISPLQQVKVEETSNVETLQMEQSASSSTNEIKEQPKVDLEQAKVPMEPQSQLHNTIPHFDYTYDPLFYHMANYLGIKPQEHLVLADKLNTILNWAVSSAGSRDAADVLHAVRLVERTLPSPGYEERRYAALYRYIKLLTRRSELDEQIKTYQVNNGPETILDINRT